MLPYGAALREGFLPNLGGEDQVKHIPIHQPTDIAPSSITQDVVYLCLSWIIHGL